ncbi:hypothetical protein GGR58DRAFT_524801 [Xylaria digitata]|nr:hypothetical protein GGR58DRAFT_524801 [Xylaria digitata]
MVLVRCLPPRPVDVKSPALFEDMEHTLQCNVLKCRKELGDRALVTTCYHIFCGDCATRLGLASQRRDQPAACPACGTLLTNPDDAVITNLKPSEDYKTSVLSGLSPNVIIDCASRALSFWAYQVTQEIIFQQHMSKTLTEKYSNLNVHLDKVVNDANAEIANCYNKLKNAEVDRDELRKKYEELLQTCKEKNRKLLQTQELYDKLKRKAMLGQVQDAAEDVVESTLQAPLISNNGIEPQEIPYFQARDTVYGQSTSIYEKSQGMNTYNYPQANIPPHAGNWPRTAGAQSDVPLTPSTHRQRIGDPTSIGLSTIPGLVVGTPRSPRRNPMNLRVPLSNITSNHFRSNNTAIPPARMSSGLKVGQGGEPSSGLITKPKGKSLGSTLDAFNTPKPDHIAIQYFNTITTELLFADFPLHSNMIHHEAHESGYYTPKYKSSPRVPVTPVVGIQVQPSDSQTVINPNNSEELKCQDGHPEARTIRGQQISDEAIAGQRLPELVHSLSLTSFPAYPAQELQTLPDEDRSGKKIKAQNRKFVILQRQDDDGILLKGPEPSEDEHQQDRIFSSKSWRAVLERFRGSSSEKAEETADTVIPMIRLTPPPEGNVNMEENSQKERVDIRHLSTIHAYKALHKDSEQENKMLRRLLPLVRLIVEAERLQNYDAAALENALKIIIEDRDRLTNIFPLATILCADQGIELDPDALDTLPQVLNRVLIDAKRAKHAAGYHKRARKELECRVSRLEGDLTRLRHGGDEDYIY